MTYRHNLNNDQIVPLALRGGEGGTVTGSMSTRNHQGLGYIGSTGRMPKAFARLISRRAEARKVSQVIYSYSTPIAWLDVDYGWIIPAETYSITTSTKHQTHLWRLDARRISAPYDATDDDMLRVLAGELLFTSKGCGKHRVFTGTVPGPNYTA